jgi:hypothetical protein
LGLQPTDNAASVFSAADVLALEIALDGASTDRVGYRGALGI